MSFDDLVKQWDGRCDLTLVSDVERAKVQWLWRDRLAAGKLTLLVGVPQVGKSQIAIDIAARISRGTRWPDG